MNSYKIRLPSGISKNMELEQDEAEYWISIGMFINHGLHAIMTVFAAEQMDDEATNPVVLEGNEEKETTYN